MADLRFEAGTPVEVRNRFDGAWVGGFEVVAVDSALNRYQVRRRSDRAVLPAPFAIGDLRVPTR
jgi:hypothetical protein